MGENEGKRQRGEGWFFPIFCLRKGSPYEKSERRKEKGGGGASIQILTEGKED